MTGSEGELVLRAKERDMISPHPGELWYGLAFCLAVSAVVVLAVAAIRGKVRPAVPVLAFLLIIASPYASLLFSAVAGVVSSRRIRLRKAPALVA